MPTRSCIYIPASVANDTWQTSNSATKSSSSSYRYKACRRVSYRVCLRLPRPQSRRGDAFDVRRWQSCHSTPHTEVVGGMVYDRLLGAHLLVEEAWTGVYRLLLPAPPLLPRSLVCTAELYLFPSVSSSPIPSHHFISPHSTSLLRSEHCSLLQASNYCCLPVHMYRIVHILSVMSPRSSV